MNNISKIDSKNIFKIIIRCLLILIFSAITGFVLLLLVYMIPTTHMKTNMEQDTTILKKEGVYPAINWKYSNTLDNFTETLMLGEAVYDSGDTLINDAVNVYHPSGFDNPLDDLTNYIQNDNAEGRAYARYWHGYLVYLKPMLCFNRYLIWRNINHVFQIILMLALTAVFIKKHLWKCAVPAWAAFLLLRPNIIRYSIVYSNVFYVTMISALVLAIIYRKNGDNRRLIYFYFVIGIVTNYVDYLTYPALSLGLNLVICAMLSQSQNGVKNLVNTIIYSITWGLGYAGMWASKWMIGSILTGNNVFEDAFLSISERSSTEVLGGAISRVSTILLNLSMVSEVLTPAIIIGITIALIIVCLWQWRGRTRTFLLYACNILIIAAIPFVWYMVLSNHSYMHVYFTFRTLSVTAAALCAIVWNIDKKCIILKKK